MNVRLLNQVVIITQVGAKGLIRGICSLCMSVTQSLNAHPSLAVLSVSFYFNLILVKTDFLIYAEDRDGSTSFCPFCGNRQWQEVIPQVTLTRRALHLGHSCMESLGLFPGDLLQEICPCKCQFFEFHCVLFTCKHPIDLLF